METRIETNDGRRRSEAQRGRTELAEHLERVMADTYVLYFLTQSFHWNVRGPLFPSLHALFEAQYEELADAVDTLAERVRAMGSLAPTSLTRIASLSSIPLDHGAPPARGMLEILLRGHDQLARTSRELADRAEQQGDGVTHDLLIARAADHEKTAWMLGAALDE